MALADDLISDVYKIAVGSWSITDGKVVPETEDIGLGNVGVRIEAVMLYADLADSTEMVVHSHAIAAEVFKAFLHCSSKIILARNGYIRSFDGDRVMGVFVGDLKNTNAATAALNINWAVTKVLSPQFNMYDVFKNGTLKIAHCTGVDRSAVLIARAGVRNNNDLIFVGQAANVAAKLSTVRESPYHSYITKSVYDAVADTAKLYQGTNMWESRTWKVLPAGSTDLYRSSWWLRP